MNRARFAALTGVFLIASWPNAVYAQYFPIAGVPGLRAMNIEIAGNMMRNSARAGGTDSEEVASRPRQITSVAALVGKLAYKPSTTRRVQNLASFVAKTKVNDPSGAAKMEQLFASSDVIATIGQGLAPFGLRVDNIADAYSAYWMSAWQASVGSTATASRAQVTKVKQQVVQALAATPEIIGASNAQKQEFAEALLVQAALIEASIEQAAGDVRQKRAIASAVRKGANAMGLDLDAMTLTENGFVPSNKGSSVDDRDIPVAPGADRQEQALAANDDVAVDSAPNYVLIAAAGGAGLGGMFLLGKAMGRKN
jgi:hypothetical protein